jgi:hypothetical protein
LIDPPDAGPGCAYCGVTDAQVYVPLQDVHGEPVWHDETGVQLFQCQLCADIAATAKAVLVNADRTVLRGALAAPRVLTCIVCGVTSEPFVDPKAFREAHPGEWTTVRHGSNTPAACHTNCTTS